MTGVHGQAGEGHDGSQKTLDISSRSTHRDEISRKNRLLKKEC